MALVYLSLGSNLGDRAAILEEAEKAIQETFQEVRFSGIYETEPVDFLDQPWFLNQIVELETDFAPKTLLEWANSLEARFHRQRTVPKGPRTLDVDILLYGDLELKRKDLTLPHPRLVERRHVLVPLAELAGEKRIPGSPWTVLEALRQVKDQTQVQPYAPT